MDANGLITPKTPPVLSAEESIDDPGEVPNAEVDARGHRCPMPLLMAKRGLNSLDSGQLLRLLSTDPGSVKDFELFARQSGHQIVAAAQSSDEYHFLIRKA